jgi:hypothetical protein
MVPPAPHPQTIQHPIVPELNESTKSLALIKGRDEQLLKMIATYTRGCSPERMVPIDALLPDGSDLAYLRSRGNTLKFLRSTMLKFGC